MQNELYITGPWGNSPSCPLSVSSLWYKIWPLRIFNWFVNACARVVWRSDNSLGHQSLASTMIDTAFLMLFVLLLSTPDQLASELLGDSPISVPPPHLAIRRSAGVTDMCHCIWLARGSRDLNLGHQTSGGRAFTHRAIFLTLTALKKRQRKNCLPWPCLRSKSEVWLKHSPWTPAELSSFG